MTPSDLIASSTMAARLSSAETLGSGVPVLPLLPAEELSELPPHPVRTSAALVTAAAAPAARRARKRAGTAASLVGVGFDLAPAERHVGEEGASRLELPPPYRAAEAQPGGLATVGEEGGLDGGERVGNVVSVVSSGVVVSVGSSVRVGAVLVEGALVVRGADVVGAVVVVARADV